MLPQPLLDALRKALAALPPGTVVAAVSGGEDSMALVGALQRVAPGRFTLAHFDHGMHGASARIAAELEAWAIARGLPWISARAAGPLRNEAEARDARYGFLAEAALGLGAPAVLTAHHQDDQAETVLLNLARGAGWAAASGMRGHRALASGVALVRPFLDVPQAALKAARAAWELPWWEDPTNAESAARRNAVRRMALPALQAHAPGAVPNLARFARLAAATDAERQEAGRSLAKQVVWPLAPGLRRLDREGLTRLGEADARAVLHAALDAGEMRSWPVVETLLELARSGRRGAAPAMLPGGWRVLADARALWLVGPAPALPPAPLPAGPFPARFEALGMRFLLRPAPGTAPTGARTTRLGAEEAGTLRLRVGRAQEDRLVVNGEAIGLGAYLRRAGVPRALRERVPVLARGQAVLWVPGLGPEAPPGQPQNPLELAILADSTGLTNLFPPP